MKLSEIERPWLDNAFAEAARIAHKLQSCDSGEIRAWVVTFCGNPSHNNLWGILFAKLANSGLIRRIGYTRSRRPAANGRIVGVWQSNLNTPKP